MNDSDPDGSITAFDLDISNPTVENIVTTGQGIFSVNNSGILNFTPASNFQGTASLPYQIFDNSGATATANISVLVTNQLPVAISDSTTTISNTAVIFNISVNDSDPDGSITAFDLDISNPTIENIVTTSAGTFSVNNSGILNFTPASNFQGTASLDYQVFDNSGATATANISVLVNNQLPIAVSDSTSTISNTAVIFNISTNDSDPDGNITAFDLNISNTSIQQNITNSQGTFSVNNNGVLVFTPTINFQGIASLPYQVFDNSGATATANISIVVGNQSPIANDDSTNTTSNTAVTLNISTNDSDIDGNITAFDLNISNTSIQQNITNSQGTFSVNDNGVLVFRPASNFQGTASLDYQVFDNSGATATANISILVEDILTLIPENILPIANDDSTNTTSNTAVTLNISANDSDPDGNITRFDLDILTAGTQNTVTISQGTLSVNNSGVLIFNPASDFAGTASLEYTVFDNSGDSSSPAKITILVEDISTPTPETTPEPRPEITPTPVDDCQCDRPNYPIVNKLVISNITNISSNGNLIGDDLIIDAITDNDGNNLIYGLTGNDTIQGTNQIDLVFAGKGDDWIQTGAGDDWVYSDFGRDTVFGEVGNDTLFGDNLSHPTAPEDFIRQDLLVGGEGNDLIYGNQDDDTLLGESGNDHIRGGKEDDLIFGDSDIDNIAGNDLLFGDAGNDTVVGSGGDDTIYGDNSDVAEVDVNTLRDVLVGDAGNDLLYGNKGDDSLCGDEGNDTLWGGKENDILCSGDGDDVLIGGFGDDTITTGGGSDQIYLTVDQGVNLIRDFQSRVDRLVLIDGLDVAELQFTTRDGGTVITYRNDNQELAILQNVSPENSINFF